MTPAQRCSRRGPHYKLCKGECVNTSKDENNCYVCGNTCPSCFICKNGSCTSLAERPPPPCKDQFKVEGGKCYQFFCNMGIFGDQIEGTGATARNQYDCATQCSQYEGCTASYIFGTCGNKFQCLMFRSVSEMYQLQDARAAVQSSGCA